MRKAVSLRTEAVFFDGFSAVFKYITLNCLNIVGNRSRTTNEFINSIPALLRNVFDMFESGTLVFCGAD